MDNSPNKRPLTACEVVGEWFIKKWQSRLTESGFGPVVRQMKKQGIPPEIAVKILVG